MSIKGGVLLYIQIKKVLYGLINSMVLFKKIGEKPLRIRILEQPIHFISGK